MRSDAGGCSGSVMHVASRDECETAAVAVLGQAFPVRILRNDRTLHGCYVRERQQDLTFNEIGDPNRTNAGSRNKQSLCKQMAPPPTTATAAPPAMSSSDALSRISSPSPPTSRFSAAAPAGPVAAPELLLLQTSASAVCPLVASAASAAAGLPAAHPDASWVQLVLDGELDGQPTETTLAKLSRGLATAVHARTDGRLGCPTVTLVAGSTGARVVATVLFPHATNNRSTVMRLSVAINRVPVVVATPSATFTSSSAVLVLPLRTPPTASSAVDRSDESTSSSAVDSIPVSGSRSKSSGSAAAGHAPVAVVLIICLVVTCGIRTLCCLKSTKQDCWNGRRSSRVGVVTLQRPGQPSLAAGRACWSSAQAVPVEHMVPMSQTAAQPTAQIQTRTASIVGDPSPSGATTGRAWSGGRAALKKWPSNKTNKVSPSLPIPPANIATKPD